MIAMSAAAPPTPALPLKAGESLLPFLALLRRVAKGILKMTPESERESNGQAQEHPQEGARPAGGQCKLPVADHPDDRACDGVVRRQVAHRYGRFRAAQAGPAASVPAAAARHAEPRYVQRCVSCPRPEAVRAGVSPLRDGVRPVPPA